MNPYLRSLPSQLIPEEELKTLRIAAHALWPRPSDAEFRLSETLSGLIAQGRSRSLMQRTLTALLRQASREVPTDSGLYRLFPQDRLALALISVDKWTLERLSHNFALTEADTRASLWSSRHRLFPLKLSLLDECPDQGTSLKELMACFDTRGDGATPASLSLHITSCAPCERRFNRLREYYHAVARHVRTRIESSLHASDGQHGRTSWLSRITEVFKSLSNP